MTTNVTPAVLCPSTQITAGPVAYIIGAALSQTIIKRVVYTNVTSSTVAITAYRVASGDTANVTNAVFFQRSLAAYATDLAPELSNMVLNGGDSIVALCNTTLSVNFTASGFVTS